MYKSKMIDMLRNFSTKELNKFSDYLASPFFNKDNDLLLFYNHIKKYAPEFEVKKVDKEKLIKKGIPGLQITEKKLGYMMSDIVDHVEGFIKYNSYFANELEGYCNILRVYNKWENDKLFDQTLRTAKDFLEKDPYRNAPYFYSCELINRQKLVATDYEVRLLKEISDHLREHSYDDYPSITIYYQILMTFVENDNDEHFGKLKKLLEEHTDKFPLDEAKDIYAYAQNYTIRKINAGNKTYLREYFNLSKQALEKNLLMVDGYLSPWTYKNIVIAALRAGEFEWTEQFIKSYKNKLNEKFRINAFNYNMGYLLFFKGQYGEALKLINQVEFTDIFYALDSRTMLIKIYYQMDEWDPMQSAIEAFKVYLRRNKTLSENVKVLYTNFLKYIDKLSRLTKRDKSKLNELKEKIEETKQVADLGWLQQKVEEKLLK